MKTTIVLMAMLAVAAAAPTVFFTRKTIPKGWSKSELAPPHAPVRFTVALEQRNTAALESLFWSVSTPGSPNYQHFLTIPQILDIVAPAPHHHAIVMNWIKTAGINRGIKDYRDAIEVMTTVERASKLFSTKFHVFTEDATGRQQIKSFGTASMPAEVREHVAFVDGLSSFPVPHLRVHVSGDGKEGRIPKVANDNFGVVPESVAALYQIPDQTVNSHPETSVGVIEFQGESYAPADLAAYAQACNVPIETITADHTVGPNDPTNPQIEAELDIEFAATVNNAAQAWFWLEDGQGWLYQFVNHYFSTATVPQVVSISYAWSEMDQCEIDPDNCQQGSQDYVERCNVEWQKIALRGNTILVASGDSGTNGRTDPDCTLPYLKPDYPACCPYVTSVGATELQTPDTNLPNPPPACATAGVQCISGGQEQAVSYDFSDFASGGGFSNYSPMPTYQTDAVGAYLASTSIKFPPASYFNATNRGFPDIAAVGHDCLIYDAGSWEPVGGTSCAAPIVAAVMSIVNQYAIKKSGKPLGFLNPFLYKMYKDCPLCFHDITVGDNICTEGGCQPSCQGFYCTVGWDPVTGLGTPNTQNIINYVNTQLFP